MLMQTNKYEFKGQTNSSRKHINNVLLIGDINLTNALQNDLAPGWRIQTIKSNRYQDLVKSINNLPKFNCCIICFSFYNNVENEILSIINAINNKNRNALINVTESIYSSNSYIRKVLSDLRMQDVRPIGLVRTREQMVKSIFHCQPKLHLPLDTSQTNSLLAHLSELNDRIFDGHLDLSPRRPDFWLFTSINGCRAGWGSPCLFPVCGWFEWPSSGMVGFYDHEPSWSCGPLTSQQSLVAISWLAAQPMHVVEHLTSWWLMFLT